RRPPCRRCSTWTFQTSVEPQSPPLGRRGQCRGAREAVPGTRPDLRRAPAQTSPAGGSTVISGGISERIRPQETLRRSPTAPAADGRHEAPARPWPDPTCPCASRSHIAQHIQRGRTRRRQGAQGSSQTPKTSTCPNITPRVDCHFADELKSNHAVHPRPRCAAPHPLPNLGRPV